jgi:hypothetical protein
MNEYGRSDDIRLDKWLCLWKDGALIPNYRKRFDMLALTNPTYQKKKTASHSKSSLFEIWLPGRDSNPRPIG